MNNFGHHFKCQRRFAPTLFTSSERPIHIIGIRTSLSGPLYPSRCHQQSPARFLRRGTSHFPLEGLCTRKQAAPHDTLGIGVLTALRATCSPTRLRPHSPVRIPCQPAPFKQHCSDSSAACFRAAIARTPLERFVRGNVAMSSLRQLDADQLEAHCPRALFSMRTTRHFLKQSVTIRAVPCIPARSQSCVSGNNLHLLNCSTAASSRLLSLILKLLPPSQATFRRTPNLVPSWNSAKQRLNLHTLHAPPAASS